jgi:gluconate 2-dehydrogenase gamma chain
MTPKMDRRVFVKVLAAGAGAVSITGSATPWTWRFFTDIEAVLVDAISEQIIPADEDPGAHDAGVVRFIDWQLASTYRRYQADYREGLRGVDQASLSEFVKIFHELDWDQQTRLLRKLESDQAQGEIWKRRSASGFFRLVRNHAMQGFYGSPRHGGNRNYASYKMLGLDYPQYIGQNRYRKG